MSDYNSGVKSIENKFLDVGDLFGLKFNGGFVFLEVAGWEQVQYAPHNQIGVVAGDSSPGFQRIEDPSGDDILFVEKGDQKVIHAAIGHSPSEVRRYTNYPESENRLRQIPNLSSPRAGDDYGYVDGDDSPYDNPSDVEELYIPPGQHLDFDFYNTDNEEHRVILNTKMRVYDVLPLDPSNSEDANAIRRVIQPGSPIPVAPVGSVRNQARYELRGKWGVDTLTRSEMEGL